MIEKKFIKDIVKEFRIEEFIGETLKNVGFSHAKLHKTPLGEKVVIYASRPGLIVGRKGENIQKLTQSLKSKFKLENPQIEIVEIENPNLDPKIVAEKITSSLERFGISKFKGIGHKMMFDAMNSGAKGIEILISGKVPSARARRWRFYQGYLKKSGDIAITGIKVAYTQAHLKTGVIGVQVRIMPPDLKMPDTITPKTIGDVMVERGIITEAKKEESESPESSEDKKEKAEKKPAKRKARRPKEEKQISETKDEATSFKAQAKAEEKTESKTESKAEPKTEEISQ